MSAPCDGVIECIDGRDENYCGFPMWLLPSVLSTSIIILMVFCFFFLRNDIKKNVRIIKLGLEAHQCVQINPGKHLRTAYFTEIQDFEEIRNLLLTEMEYHGSQGGAICCLKV